MKRPYVLTLGLLALTACGSSEQNPDTTLIAGDGLTALSAPPMDFTAPLSGSLTVSTFDSMLTGPFLEEAAQMFMAVHPETQITVSSFSSPPHVQQAGDGGAVRMMSAGDLTQERRDYVNMINTELMSGRGPDVLAMDVLPFHVYAEQGQLVDLLPFMAADPGFFREHYRTNILEAVASPAGQFMFPIDYDFRYLAYDSSLFAGDQLTALTSQQVFSFADMMAIAQLTAVDGYWFGMGVPQLFNELFAQRFDQFVDTQTGTATFTDGRFETMIEQLMAIESHLPMSAMAMAQAGGQGGGGGQTMGFNHAEAFGFKPRPSALLLSELEHQQGILGQTLVMGHSGMLGNRDNDVVAGVIGDTYGRVPFTVHQGFGINANADTETQRLAWAFIRFLSDEAMRGSTLMRGLPTHIEAFADRASLAADPAILTDYLAQVEAFTAQLNHFVTTDTLITDVVMAEMLTFFNGQQSASQVAQTLQNRISLILNE